MTKEHYVCCNRHADNMACDCSEKTTKGEADVRKRKLEDALQALWESFHQAYSDLCGEQREWHLPRLAKASGVLMQLFPRESVAAILAARTPYGDFIAGEDEE